MPYEDEPTPIEALESWQQAEPSPELDVLARAVIGAAIEVHRQLGPGHLEETYEEAMAVEMSLQSISFQRQAYIPVMYKGHAVGRTRVDFIVGGALIVELKAVDCLAPIHRAQVIAYLSATNLTLGLLINFNVPLLKDGVRRIIRS